MALSSGTRLGPYEIRDLVGAGGMGEVYRARDSRLDRDVAIKVLPEYLAQRPESLARFQKEAKAVAALSHPNILAIHDFGTEGGVTYTVTELLEGETLRSRLRKASLPWRKVIEIGAAVSEGLAAAHSKGIIHRDLKPENIFLTSDGRVKILDFGLARVKPAPTAGGQSAIPTETDAGMVMGTVGYMSPEQVRGGVADAPSDVFSLGCVLYEIVSGRKAFPGATSGDMLAAILKEDPAPLTDIPAELQGILRRCLEKNPGERFQSAHDLAFALREVADRSAPPRRVVPRTAVRAATAVALLVLAVFLYWLLAQRLHSDRIISSIAVLPLTTSSGDLDSESLGDGIAETTIGSLSRLPSLKVMSYSAVLRFKGQGMAAQDVGRRLRVDAVLAGRLARQGDNVSIRVELVSVNDGAQMWGEQYHRKLADIFAIQEEIGREISERTRQRLTGEQKKSLARRHTQSPEAFQEYVKGRYFWNKRSGESMGKAIAHFESAIAKDPTYAEAYAGLADCYVLLPLYRMVPPRENYDKARAAARKALDIDENLAEAYAPLALVKKDGDYDWAGAERELKKVLALNPGYATAHHYYAEYLYGQRRFGEAIAEAKRAQELDPLSTIIYVTFGQIYLSMRRYDQAVEQYRSALSLDPNFGFGHNNLGVVYIQKSMYSEAIAELQTAMKLGSSPITAAHLARAYAQSGNRAEAVKILKDSLARAQRSYQRSLPLALIYMGLGDHDRALEWLAKAVAERGPGMASLNAFPYYDPLRADPRFTDLLRRMNLVP